MKREEFDAIEAQFKDWGWSADGKSEEQVETEKKGQEALIKDSMNGKGGKIGRGLVIMSKYTENEYFIEAEHDIIYALMIDDLLAGGLTKEDAELLFKLGWHVDSDNDAFVHYT